MATVAVDSQGQCSCEGLSEWPILNNFAPRKPPFRSSIGVCDGPLFIGQVQVATLIVLKPLIACPHVFSWWYWLIEEYQCSLFRLPIIYFNVEFIIPQDFCF